MLDSESANSHTLIVGASSGIGFALANRLCTVGKVTALARRQEKMASLAEKGVLTKQCDVADLEGIEQIVQSAVESQGKITGLVYCAGQQQIKPLRASGTQHTGGIITVNLSAPLEFARLFASRKVADKEAVFCVISSIAANKPEPGILPYSCTKAAVEALVRGMAVELAPKRAVGVAPGWLDTEMTQSMPAIYNEEFKQTLEQKSPRGIATVESIVDTIEFLMSPKANYLTGQIITVDGGASL